LTGKLLLKFERSFLPRPSRSKYSSSWTAGTVKIKAVSSSETPVTIILHDVIQVDLNFILISFVDYPEDGAASFFKTSVNIYPSTRCRNRGVLNLHHHCCDKVESRKCVVAVTTLEVLFMVYLPFGFPMT
jgi:hypothetical protein